MAIANVNYAHTTAKVTLEIYPVGHKAIIKSCLSLTISLELTMKTLLPKSIVKLRLDCITIISPQAFPKGFDQNVVLSTLVYSL